MAATNLLTTALYIKLRKDLLNGTTENVNEFINLMNTINIDDSETLKKLLVFMNKFGKGRQILSQKFIPNAYSQKNGEYNEEYTSINANLKKEILLQKQCKLDPKQNIQFGLNILDKIDNLNNISNDLLNIDFDKQEQTSIDQVKFIQDFNKGYNNILECLSFISKYNLSHLISNDKTFKEFNIISELYNKCFMNKGFNNISNVINLKNILKPYISEKYYDIAKQAIKDFANNAEFTSLNIQYKPEVLQNLNMYNDSVDYSNIFLTMCKKDDLSSNTIDIFKNSGIDIKDHKLYDYINYIINLDPVDVFSDDKNNPDYEKIQNTIFAEILNIFKKINSSVKFSEVFNNSINGRPIMNILKTIHTNKDLFTNMKNKDVENFVETVNKEFAEYIGTDKYYTDKPKHKSIAVNIANILDDNGKINTNYLKDTFIDYTTVVTNIIMHFGESSLYTVYEAVVKLMEKPVNDKKKTSSKEVKDSFIMFRNNYINLKLFEDETPNTEDVGKTSQFSQKFDELVNSASAVSKPIIDYAKYILDGNNKENNQENQQPHDVSTDQETRDKSAENVKNVEQMVQNGEVIS